MRVSRMLKSGSPLNAADNQALFYSMKLVSDRSMSALSCSLYESLKLVMTTLERTGQFSVDMMAAYTLIALYEFGQAIYPAAYLTVGNCVRIGCILGFHDKRKATQVLPRAGICRAASCIDRLIDLEQTPGLRWRSDGGSGGQCSY